MGCDGGTIPTRDELVRTKKKPEQKDKTADLAAKWKHCAISQESLRSPIMACELGRLYNKESVLELLIDKSKFECASSFSHLRGLKDLKQLNLTDNPAFDGLKAEKGDGYIDTQKSKYICPVVGLEMNGKYKFCFLWSCACVFSERALKEIKSDVCHKCGKTFSEDDVVILNGNEDDVDEMKAKMAARRMKAKMERKSKKAEKHKADAVCSSTTEGDGPSTSKQVKFTEPQPVRSKLMNGSSALTNGKPDSKSRLSNGKAEEKTVATKSIQHDPTTSKVYKSLFTTSEKAKNQTKAHWVTYNPMYY